MVRPLGLLLVPMLLAGCIALPPPAAAPPPAPVVLGVLGHSFLRGYNQDDAYPGDHPEASWPTGEDDWTFRARVGATRVENEAQPGAFVAQLEEQAARLSDATLVIVGFGANDACFPQASGPTPPAAFEESLRSGVQRLTRRGMAVLLLSEVDLAAIHAAASPPAPGEGAAFYAIFGPACGTPDAVKARIGAYNEAIARVAKEEGVLHDGGAQGRIAWTARMISRLDGVHPSAEGARALAESAWSAYSARPSP